MRHGEDREDRMDRMKWNKNSEQRKKTKENIGEVRKRKSWKEWKESVCPGQWPEKGKKVLEKIKGMGKKKLLLLGGGCVVAVIGVSVAAVWFFRQGEENRRPQMPWGMQEMGEGVIVSSGLTSVGMSMEEWELDFLDTRLYVEESYLSVGDIVEKGTAVFKISEESLAEARKELERRKTESSLAYRQGVIDYESQKLEAEAVYQKSGITEEYADAAYEDSLQSAREEVERLKQEVEEAGDLYEEYKASIENNYYYTYYKVAELQQTYADHFSFLMDLYKKWDIEGLRDKYPNAVQGLGGTGLGGTGIGGTQATSETWKENEKQEQQSVQDQNQKPEEKIPNGKEQEGKVPEGGVPGQFPLMGSLETEGVRMVQSKDTRVFSQNIVGGRAENTGTGVIRLSAEQVSVHEVPVVSESSSDTSSGAEQQSQNGVPAETAQPTAEGGTGIEAGSQSPEGGSSAGAGVPSPEGGSSTGAGAQSPEGGSSIGAGAQSPEGDSSAGAGAQSPEGGSSAGAGTQSPEGGSSAGAGVPSPEESGSVTGTPSLMEGIQMPGGGTGGSMGRSSLDEESTKLTVYEMMVALVDEDAAAYEEAKENYEKASQKAQISLESARSTLAVRKAELQEAQLAYEKQLILSKADRDTLLAESKSAEEIYEASLKSLEEELSKLQEDSEEAEARVKLFEETIGDGYFYTKEAGTVVMNRVRAESDLSGEEGILAYSSPETVSVAAAVDQADIAKVEVGQIAQVSVSGYGWFQGSVVSINPISSSGSRSSVTYTVTIELEGDVSSLDSNLTAYVYIGMEAQQGAGGSRPGRGRSEDRFSEEGFPGEMPEGGFPEGGFPEGGFPEGGFPGEMPEGGFPEGGFPGEMPESGFPGEMPEGGFPEGGFPGEMPEGGFPEGGFPEGSRPEGNTPRGDRSSGNGS